MNGGYRFNGPPNTVLDVDVYVANERLECATNVNGCMVEDVTGREHDRPVTTVGTKCVANVNGWMYGDMMRVVEEVCRDAVDQAVLGGGTLAVAHDDLMRVVEDVCRDTMDHSVLGGGTLHGPDDGERVSVEGDDEPEARMVEALGTRSKTEKDDDNGMVEDVSVNDAHGAEQRRTIEMIKNMNKQGTIKTYCIDIVSFGGARPIENDGGGGSLRKDDVDHSMVEPRRMEPFVQNKYGGKTRGF